MQKAVQNKTSFPQRLKKSVHKRSFENKLNISRGCVALESELVPL